MERACAEFYEWAGALIERRKGDPGDDLISTLIAAEQEGDRLSDVECMNLVLNVLVGGVDTTQSQLAHGLRTFAAHPDQWELLAARPELAPRAVEELLRYGRSRRSRRGSCTRRSSTETWCSRRTPW